MKVNRTPLWQYILAIVIGAFAGSVLMLAVQRFNVSMGGVPWFISLLMLLVGIIVFVLAWQVRTYVKAEPKDRKPLSMRKAFNTLVLAKALGLAASVLAGWYASQLLFALPHREASFYSTLIQECSLASVVCCFDIVVAAISEWFCQIPPDDQLQTNNSHTNFSSQHVEASVHKNV